MAPQKTIHDLALLIQELSTIQKETAKKYDEDRENLKEHMKEEKTNMDKIYGKLDNKMDKVEIDKKIKDVSDKVGNKVDWRVFLLMTTIVGGIMWYITTQIDDIEELHSS